MQLPKNTVQCTYDSPLGSMRLACANDQLVGIWFADDAHLPDLSACPMQPQHPLLQRTQQQLAQYFAKQRESFDLPLNLHTGTEFQNAVWQALLAIALGETTSYGALAKRMGRPRAVRALGGAIGRNPISIVVPCHRVLGADGGLTGYAGGLPRKTALLQLEGVL